MTEAQLVALLEKIQALHARAGTAGERRAAAAARDRIAARLRQATAEKEVEYRFSLPDPWKRRLFLALLQRDGLRPFRYPRQRRHTIMVRAPRRVLDEKWREYEELSERLAHYLEEVTERIIAAAFHADSSGLEEWDIHPSAAR